MEKKVIRLTEEDLNKVIKESVENIIKENMANEGFWNKLKHLGSNVGNQVGKNIANKYNQAKEWGQNQMNMAKLQDYEDTMRQLHSKIQQMQNKLQQTYHSYAQSGGEKDFNSIIRGQEPTV